MRGREALLLWFATPLAQAHEGAAHLARNADPWVLLGLALAAGLYAAGTRRMRRPTEMARARPARHAALFAAGVAALALALVSPLESLGAELFSAHMVQHEVLMLVAAPLLVLGRPLAVWLWAFPLAARRAIAAAVRTAWVARPWLALTHPISAWSLHAAALWLWHLPFLFTAAQLSDDVHTLQHLSFLASALLFWNVVLRAAPSDAARGGALLYLFTTMIHTGALGALLTFSPTSWYPAYADVSLHWPLTPLEDQQLGGLIMWIPGGAVYLAVAVGITARWLKPAESAG